MSDDMILTALPLGTIAIVYAMGCMTKQNLEQTRSMRSLLDALNEERGAAATAASPCKLKRVARELVRCTSAPSNVVDLSEYRARKTAKIGAE